MSGDLAAQNELIRGCVDRHVPIVRVYHHEPVDDVATVFNVASGPAEPLVGSWRFAKH